MPATYPRCPSWSDQIVFLGQALGDMKISSLPLVVDDNPANLKILRVILQGKGYRLMTYPAYLAPGGVS